jgi:hypothetical protein
MITDREVLEFTLKNLLQHRERLSPRFGRKNRFELNQSISALTSLLKRWDEGGHTTCSVEHTTSSINL